MQSLASQTITLLKNEGGLLPLSTNSLKRIAIIGGNAKANIISGGGAASVTPSFVVNPFEGITRSLSEDTKVLYSEGAQSKWTYMTVYCIISPYIHSVQDSTPF